jgi:hypothetical protein
MQRRKKLQGLKFKRSIETMHKDDAHSSEFISANQKDGFARKLKRPALSTDMLERVDFLACLFGGRTSE